MSPRAELAGGLEASSRAADPEAEAPRPEDDVTWTREFFHEENPPFGTEFCVGAVSKNVQDGAAKCNIMFNNQARQYCGVWAEAAKRVSEYWHAEEHANVQEFLQVLREQGKIGLANRGEGSHPPHQVAWWLQWLELRAGTDSKISR
jgi:hypothetical protein